MLLGPRRGRVQQCLCRVPGEHDPGATVLLKRGQICDRQRFIVGDRSHAQVSERCTGRSLEFAQSQQIVLTGGAEHADILRDPPTTPLASELPPVAGQLRHTEEASQRGVRSGGP